MEKSDGREETQGTFGLSLVLALCMLAAFLYVLMLGPAVRWHSTCSPRVQTALEAFYAPLKWLHEHTSLETALDWYVSLWEA